MISRYPRCLQLLAQGLTYGSKRAQGIDFPRVTALVAGALLAFAAFRSYGHELDENAGTSDSGARTVSSTVDYTVPAVRMVRDDGKVVSLPDEMNDGRPVVLNFVFTTCGSICPVMSAVLSQFDRKIGADREHVHLMSISIDPEEDTPARLRDYAKKFNAGPEWQHYTGTVEASVAAQRAFNVWRGDKMSHSPVTFVRAAPGEPWLRIEGFVTPTELVRQYRQVVGHSGHPVASR
jgi:protein SCO1